MTMFETDNPSPAKRRRNANVKVVVRLRPPNDVEHSERYHTVTHAISDHMLVFDPKVQSGPGVLQAKPRDVTRHRFRDLKYAFDHVFAPCATNRDVFEHTTKGIVSGVLSGYNCSVFAYGATGAGKTHTMLGHDNEPGVIYFTMMDLYRRIDEQKQDKVFDVAISYSEVYNEQVRDLLIPRGNLPIREDKTVGVIISGLSLHKPKTAEELLHMLQFGNKNRTQHPTDANAESSRSHAVFQVFVNQREKVANGNAEVVMAKMCLVDLAGSERAHASTNCGARFREGANINRSLLALGNVINALADNKFKGHIPYRDSKLTRLLKDSLGGNCRTVMIAAVSPSSRSFEDTYNTLRYADRAKHIRTDIKKNVMNVEFHITNYKKYVQELEKQNQELKKTKQQLLETLEKTNTGSGGGGGPGPFITPLMRQFQERLKELFKVRRDIRKLQMESEGAKRELKWKVCRREQAAKRVQQLTGSLSVLTKHGRLIERMKKRIDKEEHNLKESGQQIQDQDNAISQAFSEFTTADGKQSPEFVDLLARVHIAESNLYDSDMYLTFVKKLARAQERQANVTESKVKCLLQLVKEQHDILKSHDLLTSDLEHKYDQCCYLVEERGVAFSQHAPQSNGGAGGDGNHGNTRLSPTLASAVPGEKCVEEVASVSDVIDIQIPRLRVQGLVQGMTQAKPQSQPQRILKPFSTVKSATRVTQSQVHNYPDLQTVTTTTQQNQLPGYSGVVSQGTFSVDSSRTNYNTTITTTSKISASNVTDPPQCTDEQPSVVNSHFSAHHHQFPVCSSTLNPTNFQATETKHLSSWSSHPVPPSPPLQRFMSDQSSSCSPDVNSSTTDNMNNTFQVLQPAPLPNTPCIDVLQVPSSHPHQSQNIINNPTPIIVDLENHATPIKKDKNLHSHFSKGGLNFHSSVGTSKDSHVSPAKALMGEGDGVRDESNFPSHLPIAGVGDNTQIVCSQNKNKSFNAASLVTGAGSSLPVYMRRPGTVGSGGRRLYHANTNNANSANPNDSAEIQQSPAACQIVTETLVKTPSRVKLGSSEKTVATPARVKIDLNETVTKTPLRVKIASASATKDNDLTATVPTFDFSHVKQKLLQTCEKLPARVETNKLNDVPVRQPLGSLDPNTKQKATGQTESSKQSDQHLLVNDVPNKDHLAQPTQTQLKAKPMRVRDRKYDRRNASSNPYVPRRQLVKGTLPSAPPTENACNRPSYMLPTFARSQKMRRHETLAMQTKQATLPKRFALV